MCSLDQPAPEVVAQVDAGVGGLGFAGGARRLGRIDAREVACAVVVVALDLAVGQFAGHDAALAIALVALALAQGVVHFDERSPAVVVVVRAVARAVGVAEQLARVAPGQLFAAALGVFDAPGAVAGERRVLGVGVVVALGAAIGLGDLGEAPPGVVFVAGGGPCRVGGGEQAAGGFVVFLLGAAPVGQLHADEPALAITPEVDAAPQRVGARSQPAEAVEGLQPAAAIGLVVGDEARQARCAFKVVGLDAIQAVADAGGGAWLAVGARGLGQVVEAVAEPFLVAVLDDAGTGLGALVAVAVPGSAGMAVGADAVVVPFEFAHELACAVVDGDEVACAAVAVAHEGDGGGQGMHRVLHQIHACDSPAVVGSPQTQRIPAAMDALVQQPVAPACAVAQRDQAACGHSLFAGTVAGLRRGAIAVVVELAAPEAVDLGHEAPRAIDRFTGRRTKAPERVPIAADRKDGLRVAHQCLLHMRPARVRSPGRCAAVRLRAAAAQQPDVFAGTVQLAARHQRLVEGDDAAAGIQQQGGLVLQADAELLQQVPAMAQQAAGRAVLGVDVAAVLALPGHGQRSRWQGKVQVLCAQQDLGAELGVHRGSDGDAVRADGAGQAPLAADEHGARAGDDLALDDAVGDTGCGFATHARLLLERWGRTGMRIRGARYRLSAFSS
ncbi:hypothetical protein BW39_00547 [Delftia sp. RIT313]|nr:hypothetical protein BW39_00547 [Delftia sp. RIT313]